MMTTVPTRSTPMRTGGLWFTLVGVICLIVGMISLPHIAEDPGTGVPALVGFVSWLPPSGITLIIIGCILQIVAAQQAVNLWVLSDRMEQMLDSGAGGEGGSRTRTSPKVAEISDLSEQWRRGEIDQEEYRLRRRRILGTDD